MRQAEAMKNEVVSLKRMIEELKENNCKSTIKNEEKKEDEDMKNE